MKKSLLALAALTAFAGAASAQSSVTLYGRVDMSFGQAMGEKTQYLSNGSGSRFGVRGVEDLGGGMKAIFNIEHRFEADTGVTGTGCCGGTSVTGNNAATNVRFWNGRSIVGLQGGWGEINLGREYTTAFLQNQLVADPWGYDTVVSGRYGTNGNSTVAGLGGLGRVRNDSAVTWKFAAGGFSVQAQYAEGTDNMVQKQENPWNMALGYSAGPWNFNYAYEASGDKAAKSQYIQSLLGQYKFSAFMLSGYYAWGEAANGDKRNGYLLAGTAPFGQGELRVSYGSWDNEPSGGSSKTMNAPFAVGYHYALSKRTTIYADYAYDGKITVNNKYGYDFGIKHNF